MTESEIKRILFGALFLLGPNGENWTNLYFPTKSVEETSGKHCAWTAIGASIQKLKLDDLPEGRNILATYMNRMVVELGFEIPSLIAFNDNPKTTFANIKELFELAISSIKA
jgi:hypothetical protein